MTTERVVYRSAMTGRFVSAEYARRHPDVTIRQVVKCAAAAGAD